MRGRNGIYASECYVRDHEPRAHASALCLKLTPSVEAIVFVQITVNLWTSNNNISISTYVCVYFSNEYDISILYI